MLTVRGEEHGEEAKVVSLLDRVEREKVRGKDQGFGLSQFQAVMRHPSRNLRKAVEDVELDVV